MGSTERLFKPLAESVDGSHRRGFSEVMQILVLGGTAWLGRAIVDAAISHGHEVTCLARGTSGAPPSQAKFVPADRDQPSSNQPYGSVVGEDWDVVVDVARHPGQVREAVAALKGVARRFIFVSSSNVYASQRPVNQTEEAPLVAPLESDVMKSMADYGEAKVACESAVVEAFGTDRSLIVRSGLIGGPGDWSGRSGYWPWRFANPSNPRGAVLVPESGELASALIDVRDLAAWLVGCGQSGLTGVFNAAANRMTFADHLACARRVAGHEGSVASASTSWLLDSGVQAWMGEKSLPLWLNDPDWLGFQASDTQRAEAAGLTARPLTETLADTLDWELSRDVPGPHGAGLTDAEERDLLAALS